MENKFLYAYLSTFLGSLVLLLIQGIVNYSFYNSNNRKNIVKRTLYEQFSYEVYSSIKKNLGTRLSINSECSNDEEQLEFNVNLDTFFDCRGIYTNALNSNCQNTITKNYTNCVYDSQRNINYDEKWDKLDYDPRNEYCKYYSNFTRKISILYNNRICKSKSFQYDYEYLLRNSIPSNDYQGIPNECISDFKKCGYLDTKGHILCLPKDNDCPINMIEVSPENRDYNLKLEIEDNKYIYLKNDNNKNIINSIIISENMPLIHEWDKMIKETYEDLEDEEKNKRRSINGEDFLLFDSKNGLSYQPLFVEGGPLNINVSHIKANNSIEGFNRNLYNLEQKLDIYTRSYIGFKNAEELDKFKKYFNDKNDRDNPLYRLSSSKHNPLITIIFPCIFIVLTILYLVFKIRNILSEEILEILFYIFIAFIVLFWIVELIIIIYHFRKYPTIKIDMDDRMEKILDDYNSRNIKCQVLRIISLIINTISIILILIGYCKKKKVHEELPDDINE